MRFINGRFPDSPSAHLYLGHFDAFDWNLLARRGMGETSFHPEFDKLFERGIDPNLDMRRPETTPGDWPKQVEVERYNCVHVNGLMPAWMSWTRGS